MLEIGDTCKIEMDETLYRIINTRTKKIKLIIDENTTKTIIENFVDLEEIDNPKNKIIDVSIINIYPS
ncbi:TPA: hypothetical protein ACT5CK_002298 [Flavobacterium psychrophilum]|jgi:hypothetical protein|uniref:hypothetical protein n=1 Tax=Flavobacterium psychrophilum TaxID=96345 RepID=UPI00073E41BB|nr:hypothetical protein [Flavobacterium psychrophilum]GAQ50102.1 hypothetical protein FPK15_contig00102-0006 [Flavobacterium psychrophilum]GEJ33925.1 hypothetical protein FPN185_contig00089-0004 [Flavobacterium psychrophilum]GEJ34145.1 hypothetical protein FPN181_contig00094-0004 [Flavobacterium psychrophilum]GEJ40663.1 hypothetical protein FPN187_contig00096-0004 [Flavobacterium psychrophilum]GEJ42352.1 hypothetical protein FPN182_contig00068-0004 [Flavobacterium psychrophilum]